MVFLKTRQPLSSRLPELHISRQRYTIWKISQNYTFGFCCQSSNTTNTNIISTKSLVIFFLFLSFFESPFIIQWTFHLLRQTKFHQERSPMQWVRRVSRWIRRNRLWEKWVHLLSFRIFSPTSSVSSYDYYLIQNYNFFQELKRVAGQFSGLQRVAWCFISCSNFKTPMSCNTILLV